MSGLVSGLRAPEKPFEEKGSARAQRIIDLFILNLHRLASLTAPLLCRTDKLSHPGVRSALDMYVLAVAVHDANRDVAEIPLRSDVQQLKLLQRFCMCPARNSRAWVALHRSTVG